MDEPHCFQGGHACIFTHTMCVSIMSPGNGGLGEEKKRDAAALCANNHCGEGSVSGVRSDSRSLTGARPDLTYRMLAPKSLPTSAKGVPALVLSAEKWDVMCQTSLAVPRRVKLDASTVLCTVLYRSHRSRKYCTVQFNRAVAEEGSPSSFMRTSRSHHIINDSIASAQVGAKPARATANPS